MAAVSARDTPDYAFIARDVPLPGNDRGLNEGDAAVQAQTSSASESSLDLLLTQANQVLTATAPISPTALWTRLPDSDAAIPPDGSELPPPAPPVPTLQEGSVPPTNQLRSEDNYAAIGANAFAERVRQLEFVLPHLQNVKHRSRQQKAALHCYDFSGRVLTITRYAAFRSEQLGFYTDDNVLLEQFLRREPVAGVDLRLLVADGLSSDLIELLGSALDISPEAFEEHLIGSGWRNGSGLDRPAETWITRDMAKDYLSVTWYRPVLKRLQKPDTLEDRAALLEPRESKVPLTWVEEIHDKRGKVHRVHHSMRPLSNVLRKAWDIHGDVADRKSTKKAVAWEERATIWSRTMGSFRVGKLILLDNLIHTSNKILQVVTFLDPLPVVSHQASGAEVALETLGLWPLDSPPATVTNDSSDDHSTHSQASRTQRRRTPNAFVRKRARVERSTQGSGGLLSVPYYALNFFRAKFSRTKNEGLPRDTENAQSVEDRVSASSRSTSVENQPRLRNIFVENIGGVSYNYAEADVVNVGEDIGVEILSLNPTERSLFHGLLPRGPPMDYSVLLSPENSVLLRRHLNTETSTAVDVAAWISHQSQTYSEVRPSPGPMDCLFILMYRDTLKTLGIMDEALTQIGREILDDSLIQQRLINWRLLLERFGVELRALELSLRKTAKFISTITITQEPSYQEKLPNASNAMTGLLEQGVAEIVRLQQRTSSSYQSLMTNMSIVESKRGIAEAEGVSKLTELAFFFIPLTFSASIFSMQVKELQNANISVSAFITLAVVVTLLSYALRLFIRSQPFTRRRLEWIQEIRVDAGISSNAPIPTTTFIAWLWRRLGLLMIVVILTVALNVSPIAVLWTRNMNHGFKALITVLLLLFNLFCSYVMIVALLYVDATGLHFRRNMFTHELKLVQKRSTPDSNSSNFSSFERFSWMQSSWFLLSLTATVVAAGPIAALWTRPLTTGIKLGATFAIGFIYLGCILYLLLHAISQGDFNRRQEEIEGNNSED